MLLLRVLIASALVALVQSTTMSTMKSSKKMRSKAKSAFFAKVDKAFKSDKFRAVGSLRGQGVLDDTYSPTGTVFQAMYVEADGSVDDTCSDLSSMLGFVVNQCIVADNYAFKFQLTSDSCAGAITQYYGDVDCTAYLGFSSFDDVSLDCAPTEGPSMFPNEYQQTICSTSTDPIYQNLPQSMIAVETFVDLTCSGATQEFYAMVADKCYGQDDGGATGYMAFKCTDGMPMETLYNAPGCDGAPDFEFDFPSQCYPDDGSGQTTDDQYSGDDQYNADDMNYIPHFINPPPSVSTTPFPTSGEYTRSTAVYCSANQPTSKPVSTPTVKPTKKPSTSKPSRGPTTPPTTTPTATTSSPSTRAPTRKPTTAPTKLPTETPSAAPTEVPSIVPTAYPTRDEVKKVSFTVNQAISGINAVTFNADPANAAALTKTITDSLVDALAVVTNLVVTDTTLPTARARILALRAGVHSTAMVREKHPQASESLVNAAYTVTSSTAYTAHQLYSQLTTAVNTGAFDTTLAANAQSLGASDVATCSSSSAVVASEDDDVSASEVPDNSLDGAGIFGVVVGGLFIGAMFVGALYVVFIRKG